MRHTADQPTDRKTDRLRLTVPEAAKALGISPEAVRNRLSRRTLDSEKVNGTVHVLIDRDMVRHTDDRPNGTPDDVSSDMPGRDELVDELRDRIGYLERQVEEEREARRRADTLLARLMDRVPELEAPETRQEDAQDSTNGAAGPRPPTSSTSPQNAAQRPWWRRVFGG